MNFEWDLDEEAESFDPQKGSNRPEPRRRRWGVILVGFIFAAGLAGLSWWRINRFDNETLAFLQAATELQSIAVAERDGDLYLTNFGGLPSSHFDKLHPLEIQFWQSRPTITDFEQFELEIWAQAEWVSPQNERLYRTLFFNDWNSSIRLKTESDVYWQGTYGADLAYGRLSLTERDRPFEGEFIGRLNRVLEEKCESNANLDCTDLQVSIAPRSFTPTDDFEFVSPRLYGLTADGQIPLSYWTYFDNRLADLTGGNVIRFGVPEQLRTQFDLLVSAYVASSNNSTLEIEIVTYQAGTVDYEAFLQTVDGAFMSPNLDIVTSGAIVPVTKLAEGMHTEIFGQHWASAWWQDQMWFLPVDGELYLISSDNGYASDVGLVPASFTSWSWERFEAVMDTYKETGGLQWGVVLPNPTLLLSRAYGHDNDCEIDTPPVICSIELSADGVADALTFYAENSDRISVPPEGTVDEQTIHFTTEASVSVGHAGMWVSRPRYYEHDLSTRNSSVQPLPHVDGALPVYPIIIRGGVISSFSEAPITTWRFIDWLSYREISIAERTVPARFRTTIENRYWDKLPDPLRTPMQDGFVQSRPVRLGDAERFRPDVLERVADGSLSPEAAARERVPLTWFGVFFSDELQAN